MKNENKIFAKGTKLFITVHTGIAGTDEHYFYELSEDTDEDTINSLCYELANENAASFGIYSMRDMPEDIDEEDEDIDSYSDNIEGYFAIYNSAEHDMYTTGGIVVKFEEF